MQSDTIHPFRGISVFGAVTAGFLAVGGNLVAQSEHPGPDHPGAKIYQKLCVECHAENGEGVKDKADDPLRGNRDIAELSRRIEKTMPEDEEDKCVGPDAKAVAEYIYHAFYSVEARARNTPARIDLTRLTVPQYQQSVADLVLSFRGNIGFANERGLKANYFGDRNFNERKEFKDQKKPDRFERIDPNIRFDYGEGVPSFEESKEFSKEGFSIRWEGTLLAEETGTYEFVIRTRNGATLWVNEQDHGDDGKKTIDAWVSAGNDVREETGSEFLIGGRPYPIRLEFFKYKGKAASIELLWKTPHGVLEPIPERNLTPFWVNESLVVDTPFPADDRSVGYERGTSVSKTWFDAITAGAITTADYVVDHLDALARTKSDQPDRAKKIGDFGVQFVERAFRRPLSEEERIHFVDHHYQTSDTLELAVKRLVLMTLTSPRFLYPNLPHGEEPDQWDTASRLALTLWDSIPDDRLRDLAKKGKLATREQIEAEANRMTWDWRTRTKLRGFFHHWLELERAEDLAKDKEVFPEFNDAVLADLRTSLNLFIEAAVWGEGGNYRQLMQADYLYLNERLGKLYGADQVKGDFQKVSLDPNQRAGLVTHPFLLTSLAYHNNTSPIHRGVFLTRNIVGMTLKSPPMANVFKDSKFDPSLTMREKVTEMTRSQACMGCHVTINPLGFSLEHYDGIGRWRMTDREKPVNSTSDFKTDTGQTIKLTGARDVAEYAANSQSAHRAFVQQLFHHLVKQPVLAYGDDKMETLRTGFEQSNYYIPELIKRISIIAATEGTVATVPTKVSVAGH
ncbi:MAG: DUF1592 domain-containing protein [Verrucomicrobiae bacterium]|nr:DUF1592 domain-containing protein [Verrucomicrobiae bacterium]